MSPSRPPRLTSRFEDALAYAARIHAGFLRKGSEVPYISHLLSVAALVLEDGGDEDQVIAALLHDAPEDLNGRQTLEEIRLRYGDHVAELVLACSDALEHPKPPWRQRKEAHLEHLRNASPAVCRIMLADKLHNARSILHDLRLQGDKLWKHFKGGKRGTLWYLRSMHGLLGERCPGPLVDELGVTLSEIESLVEEGAPSPER